MHLCGSLHAAPRRSRISILTNGSNGRRPQLICSIEQDMSASNSTLSSASFGLQMTPPSKRADASARERNRRRFPPHASNPTRARPASARMPGRAAHTINPGPSPLLSIIIVITIGALVSIGQSQALSSDTHRRTESRLARDAQLPRTKACNKPSVLLLLLLLLSSSGDRLARRLTFEAGEARASRRATLVAERETRETGRNGKGRDSRDERANMQNLLSGHQAARSRDERH